MREKVVEPNENGDSVNMNSFLIEFCSLRMQFAGRWMDLLLMSHYITRHILHLISTTIIFTLHAINFRFRYLVYLQFAVDASRIEVDAPHLYKRTSQDNSR